MDPEVLVSNALKEEINFWQKMLVETDYEPTSPEYQRMVMALRLAEYRLNPDAIGENDMNFAITAY